MSTATTPARGTRRAAPTCFKCRLILPDQSYSLTPLRPDPGVAKAAFRLHKLSEDGRKTVGDSYDVSFHDDSGHQCQCLGWLRWHKCRHVRMLIALGLLPPLPESKPAEESKPTPGPEVPVLPDAKPEPEPGEVAGG
jgi:hypothetical protein